MLKEMNRNVLIGGGLIAVLLVIGVVVKDKLPLPNVPSENQTATTTGEFGAEGTGNFTIEQVPVNEVESLPPSPNLNRQVRFTASTEAEVRAVVLTNIATLTSSLKANTDDLESWVSLGAMYKIAGDYAAARDAWEYASIIRPYNYPSFGNLGDLYHHYLKNYPKAESNYLRAIQNEPEFIDGYRGLYELYRYSFSGKGEAAAQILKRGITANPQAYDLMILLGDYYRDRGEPSNAVTYYEQALMEVKRIGNTTLGADLEVKISALK